MKALVLGGTQFVGRHIVGALLAAGHEVSIFSRGKTNPGLFPEATHLTGDRDSDLSAITGDSAACVDVSGYTTSQVRRTTEHLKGRVGRYIFISTVSVYKAPIHADFNEDAPVEEVTDPDAELRPETYGMLKVSCENTVREAFGGQATIFRLGLVSGPYDHTDRSTYWMVRAAEGGEVFVPAGPDDPFQVIDARDIGGAVVRGATTDLSGTFNLVNEPTTWRHWLETAAGAGSGTVGDSDRAGVRAAYIFADDQEWVEAQADKLTDTRPKGALPMYLPRRHGWNFWLASNRRAREAGITFRRYGDTIADTLAWRGGDTTPLQAGLTPEQERTLIEAWRSR